MTNKNHDSFLERFRDTPPDPKYTEILRLEEMLNDAKIPGIIIRHLDGYIIDIKKDAYHRICSVEQRVCSRNRDKNLVELRIERGTRRSMTAEEAFEEVRKGWEETE